MLRFDVSGNLLPANLILTTGRNNFRFEMQTIIGGNLSDPPAIFEVKSSIEDV